MYNLDFVKPILKTIAFIFVMLLLIVMFFIINNATKNRQITALKSQSIKATLYVNGCVLNEYHAETSKDSLVIKNIGWISPAEIDSIVVTRGK